MTRGRERLALRSRRWDQQRVAPYSFHQYYSALVSRPAWLPGRPSGGVTSTGSEKIRPASVVLPPAAVQNAPGSLNSAAVRRYGAFNVAKFCRWPKQTKKLVVIYWNNETKPPVFNERRHCDFLIRNTEIKDLMWYSELKLNQTSLKVANVTMFACSGCSKGTRIFRIVAPTDPAGDFLFSAPSNLTGREVTLRPSASQPGSHFFCLVTRTFTIPSRHARFCTLTIWVDGGDFVMKSSLTKLLEELK